LVDRVKGKLDCRPYRGGGEGNPKKLVEAASRAFSNRSNIFTIRAQDRQKLREENGSACYQMRTDVVSLVTVLITREKVLPDQPEPSCFQTGKVSDSKQWTEVQTYLESIDKKIMQ
jgi:hypothetical protein